MLRGPLFSLLAASLAACSSPAPTPDPIAQAKAAPPPEAADVRSDLPPELSEEDLRQVLDPLKVDARRTCNGVNHGKEMVEIELTIAGSTGIVSHTSVALDGGNPALGTCVANELARAVFKPTRKASTRTRVKVTF